MFGDLTDQEYLCDACYESLGYSGHLVMRITDSYYGEGRCDCCSQYQHLRGTMNDAIIFQTLEVIHDVELPKVPFDTRVRAGSSGFLSQ